MRSQGPLPAGRRIGAAALTGARLELGPASAHREGGRPRARGGSPGSGPGALACIAVPPDAVFMCVCTRPPGPPPSPSIQCAISMAFRQPPGLAPRRVTQSRNVAQVRLLSGSRFGRFVMCPSALDRGNDSKPDDTGWPTCQVMNLDLLHGKNRPDRRYVNVP